MSKRRPPLSNDYAGQMRAEAGFKRNLSNRLKRDAEQAPKQFCQCRELGRNLPCLVHIDVILGDMDPCEVCAPSLPEAREMLAPQMEAMREQQRQNREREAAQ